MEGAGREEWERSREGGVGEEQGGRSGRGAGRKESGESGAGREERVRREKELHFQEDVYVQQSTGYVPTHILWSLPNWKPVRESHIHWKEPGVLTQRPRGSQPSIPIAHSSMSEGKKEHSQFDLTFSNSLCLFS